MSLTVDSLLFVGLNSRVAALDKRTGELVWSWKSPSGSGYVSLLVEEDTLFVSVNGYTYSLDARSGEQIWFNKLAGFGSGVACLAVSGIRSSHAMLAQAASRQAASGAGGTGAAG